MAHRLQYFQVKRPTKDQAEHIVIGVISVAMITYAVFDQGWRKTSKSMGKSLALQFGMRSAIKLARQYGR